MTDPTPPSSTAAPAAIRALNRDNRYDRNTSGVCAGYTQANLVVLPRADAFDFLRFCQRNPGPCPILEVTEPGRWEPRLTAAGADLRTDIARYQVYRKGALVEERTDIIDLYTEDMVGFLLGCSYSFEHLLAGAGVPIRHHEQGIDGAPMYVTDRDCEPAGGFAGKLVVTMRPIPGDRVTDAVLITAAHPESHGAPVHIGSPEALGIVDIGRPDIGDPVRPHPGDTPVFWACGVTSQHIAIEAEVDYMITHASGYMFITDLPIGGRGAAPSSPPLADLAAANR